MKSDREPPRPQYTVLTQRAITIAGATLLVLGVGLAVLLMVAYRHGTEADRVRLDAIRTAGTIVVGAGGAGALWLAARRQRTTEIALKQKEHDQYQADRTHELNARTAADNKADAAERLVTELYSKAVEQVGSAKAAVRMGGLFALERLAQNVPGQRQTIVNVLCAYLRMSSEDDEPQEVQVRLTAQRILVAHLRRGTDAFWSGIALDLSDATLANLDLNGCTLADADFSRARFGGVTSLRDAVFDGFARFDSAEFGGECWFATSEFRGDTTFEGAEFRGPARFDQALFSGRVNANRVRFTDECCFIGARFSGSVAFDETTFEGDALMQRTGFSSDASFDRVRFNGDLRFTGAWFAADFAFEGTRYRDDIRFDDVAVQVATTDSVARILPTGHVIGTEQVAAPDGGAGVWRPLTRS